MERAPVRMTVQMWIALFRLVRRIPRLVRRLPDVVVWCGYAVASRRFAEPCVRFPNEDGRQSTEYRDWLLWEGEYVWRGYRAISLESWMYCVNYYHEPVMMGQRREVDEEATCYAPHWPPVVRRSLRPL